MADQRDQVPPEAPEMTANDALPSDAPEVSPYASSTCQIYCKDNWRFSIPYDFIHPFKSLVEAHEKYAEIFIRNVPYEAAHVLVHYLHTGTWQTLRRKLSPHDSHVPTAFEVAAHVYAVARAYNIPGLADLAKDNILRSAKTMSPLDVIVSATEAYQLLREDDLWFMAWIKTLLEQLFEHSASPDQPALLECFRNNPTPANILFKTMVRICSEKCTSVDGHVSPTERQPVSPPASGCSEDVPIPEPESTLEPVPASIDGQATEDSPDPEPVAETSIMMMPEAEAAVESPPGEAAAYIVEAEPEPPAESPPEVAIEWTPNPKKDKKKKKPKMKEGDSFAEVPQEYEPIPTADGMESWRAEPEVEPEPAIDPQLSFTPKKGKKNKNSQFPKDPGFEQWRFQAGAVEPEPGLPHDGPLRSVFATEIVFPRRAG